MKKVNFAKLIDHTILKPNVLDQEVEALCSEAKKFGFASVCLNPSYVALAKSRLAGSDVKVCTVIGFPLGQNTTRTKIFEAEDAIELGAVELDYVVNVSDVLNERYAVVKAEMEQFAGLKQKHSGILIKIILETCYLSLAQISKLCQLAKEANLDFVKTSTGFGSGGATVEQVELMRKTVGPTMGVKASGGIRSYEDAFKMVEAGASRIGASAGVRIVSEAIS
ncbi:deoxyribose-phosphate aldolase [Desulfosporosinus fructosivorans]|uniref:deoxyribose-phosphate aldolase n=1 Tax=Desulfosporosinus fructosivorans TaxID=2018669 RepID=UPI0018EE60DA|nr:deoxyribose-phosphate aldolase [Desulfosporosinus fructosivorans]